MGMHLLIMYVHREHARKVLFTKSALFYGMIMANMEAHNPDVPIGGSTDSAEPLPFDFPNCYLDYVVKVRFYSSLGGKFPEEEDKT